MSFRIICAFYGILFLFLMVYFFFFNDSKDQEFGIKEIILGFGVSFYFLYYAFWQGRNRIPETVKKAELGDLESQLQLALHYSWGEKAEPNFEEAFKLGVLTLMNTVNSSMYGLNNFNFLELNSYTKLIMIIFMIIGRVELLTILIIVKKFIFKS